jgi:YVTN family beta-propeller protein
VRLLHAVVLPTLVATLTGSLPGAAAAQECLYVLDQLNNAVTMVRRDSNAVVGSAPMPMDDCPNPAPPPDPPCHPMPTSIEFSASSGRVYVTRQDVKLVYVIDPVAETVVDSVTIDSGSAPNAASAASAVSPNGATLYVANLAADSVSVIATSSNELVDTIPVGDQPRAVAFTPNGDNALIGNNLDDTLSVVRTSDGEVIDTIEISAAPTDRRAPAGIAVAPNGTRAYVTNGISGSVSVIDLGSGAVIDTIDVGQSPRGIVITPDGATAFVTNVLDGTVSVIDTASGSVSGSPITVGAGPVAVALSNDGSAAYVANLMSSTVSVIDTESRAVDTIEGVSAPFDLSFGPCPPPEPGDCVGDCDGGGSVSIGELITGVNIALSRQPLSACVAFDRDGSDSVSIGELISAVSAALNGCPP